MYNEELRDPKTVIRQRATAMYLIDKVRACRVGSAKGGLVQLMTRCCQCGSGWVRVQLALRAGNEKDTDEEADTVGCCSLRVEHITLREPNTVIFDFLGAVPCTVKVGSR